jgi:hypothetical protein
MQGSTANLPSTGLIEIHPLDSEDAAITAAHCGQDESRRVLPLPCFTDAVLQARDLDTSQSSRTQSVASALNNNYDQGHGI